MVNIAPTLNKVDTKKDFIDNFNTKTYKSLLLALGFDISSNRKQGYRTFDNNIENEINLSWYQIKKDTILNGSSFINFKTKTNVTLFHNVNSRVITNHLYGKYTNSIRNNKFYKELYDNNIINNYNENESKAITATVNKTFGISMYKNRKVIMFDIDNHTNSYEIGTKKVYKTISHLLSIFNTLPVFYEQSINGGVHIAFKLSENIDDTIAKAFTQSFNKKYNDCAELEVALSSKIFRAPDSSTYNIHKFEFDNSNYGFKTTVINDYNTLDIKYKNIINNINDKEYTNNISVLGYNDTTVKSKSKRKYKKVVSAPAFYKRNNKNIISRSAYDNEITINNIHYKTLSLGNKHNSLFSNAYRAIYNKIDLYDFIDHMEMCLDDSKDLTSMSYHGRVNYYTGIYNFSTINYDPEYLRPRSKNIDFVSNAHHVNDDLKKVLEKNIDMFKKHIIRDSGLSSNALKKMDILNNIFEDIFYELVGKIIYDYITPREVINGNDELKIGFQFPRVYVDKLKTHVLKKHNMLNLSIDINRIVNTFKASNMFKKYIHSNGYTYTYGKLGASAEQFYLSNMEGVLSEMDSSKESITLHLIDVINNFMLLKNISIFNELIKSFKNLAINKIHTIMCEKRVVKKSIFDVDFIENPLIC